MWHDVRVPKNVDHQQRRKLIAEALLRVAAERGIEAVSVRHVAAEAGVTSGMVQHYFRTKTELMQFAMEVVRENIAARLSADPALTGTGEGAADDGGTGDDAADRGAPGAAPGPTPVTELVRSLFVQLLPLDEERRTEGRVALAFMAYAAGHPEVANAIRRDNAALREVVANQIRAAQESGQVRADLDSEHLATALMALVEGLGMQALNGDYSPETALKTFDTHLALLFSAAAS